MLEADLKARTQEVYSLSEQLILAEYKGASLDEPLARMATLQDRYDRLEDTNARRVKDFRKLRETLNRLNSDLSVFKLSLERKA